MVEGVGRNALFTFWVSKHKRKLRRALKITNICGGLTRGELSFPEPRLRNIISLDESDARGPAASPHNRCVGSRRNRFHQRRFLVVIRG